MQDRYKKTEKELKKDLNREIKKKKSGLEKMQKKLIDLQSNDWRELGEWLLAEQSLENVTLQMASEN